MGSVLYLIFTSDIPELSYDTIATFSDDTVSMTGRKDHEKRQEVYKPPARQNNKTVVVESVKFSATPQPWLRQNKIYTHEMLLKNIVYTRTWKICD